MIDKNQAVIDFLVNCPQLKNNPVFFNFINAKDNNKQILVMGSDQAVNTPFIDGSVQKIYTFTIIDFRSVTYQALVKLPGYENENVQELLDVQSIIDWVNEQSNNYNYPNFGEDCLIDEMIVTSNSPMLNGIDTSANPALAKYSITIQIKYIDNSKKLWN